MIQDDARSADCLARAAHCYRARAAWLVSEGAGPCGGEISGHDEAGVGRSRNTVPGQGQVIEIVGSRAADKRSSACESHQAGAASEGPIIGPVSSD